MTATEIFALIVFTFLGTLGFVVSVVWTVNSNTALKMLSRAAGWDLQRTAGLSEETGRALKFLLGTFTSQMTGLNLFALLIVWFPFRQGEGWAWMALWFYPVMFAWHRAHYAKGTGVSKMQVVYGLLSGVALLLTYPRFF